MEAGKKNKHSTAAKALLAGLLGALMSGHLPAQPDLGGTLCGPTIYDSYIENVRPVLKQLHGSPASFNRVTQLMGEIYKMRHVRDATLSTAPPSETDALGVGGCRAKALWLAKKMGDPNVRFIIGWANLDRNVRHAWLAWRFDGQWWILDPTWQKAPIAAARVGTGEYIISYSYTGAENYYHTVSDHLQMTLAGFNSGRDHRDTGDNFSPTITLPAVGETVRPKQKSP